MAALSSALVLSAATVAVAGEPSGADVRSMIRSLYADFDPRKDPLDIEMIKEWDEGEVHYEQLYFTGQIVDGVKTRVYAYRGAPKSGDRLPGVLYCHGGGQTAYLEWVRFWAKQGYVCVSFDYSGDTNKYNLPEYKREHFTKWGAAVEKMMAGPGSTPMPERLKYESWYHFCLAAQRSLTLLENHPRVDRSKLGAYGVSAGGYLCWFLAATDSRVKTIVPIYGAGAAFRDASGVRIANVTPEMEAQKFIEGPGNPVFYAPMVTCPVLYLTATNDGSFNLDHSFDTIDALGSKTVRLLYTPRYSHHIEPPETRSLPLWMDWQLRGQGGAWPETPTVEVTWAKGVPQIRVTPDQPAKVEKVDVYYCLNNDWALTRFWRDGSRVRREGQSYAADAPFLRPGDRIYAFANVVYRSGRRVSSRVIEAQAAALSGARPTLLPEALIDSMEATTNWTWVPAYPDPKIYESYFQPWKGPDGTRGFTVRPFECDNPPFVMKDGTLKFFFGTAKIGDPQWQGGKQDEALLLDYYVPNAPSELTVRLVTRVRGKQTEYTFQPQVTQESAGWQTLRMERAGFKNADGAGLVRWDAVQFLAISGICPVERTPVFRNLRWERSVGMQIAE